MNGLTCPTCGTGLQHQSYRHIPWHHRPDGVPCWASGMRQSRLFSLGGPVATREWATEHAHPELVLSCPSGKIVHETEDLAEEAAVATTRTNLRFRRPEGRTAARAYRCTLCPWFHVTSEPFRAR